LPVADDYLIDDDSALRCVDGGNPTFNPTGWAVLDGYIAEPVQTFASMFPDCTPNTTLVVDGSN
jgi:hypothetical protein